MEQAEWEPHPDAIVSHRERIRQTGSYERSVPPRIASLVPTVSAAVLADIDEATAEVVRFDSDVGVSLSSFGALLLRSEAAASSRIEALTASARVIAEAEVQGIGSANAEEILANTHTMEEAIGRADRLDSAAILAMHERLLVAWQPHHAGQWRTQQVWIGAGTAGPRLATFVPPRAELVPELVDDLVSFLGQADMPVLVQAAVGHAQFETIHPFVDGNGRTGRALIHALLHNKRLTVNSTVPVSAGLLADTASYFDALTAYRTGDVDPIVAMVAGASIRAVANARILVDELADVRAGWNDRVRARRQADAWRLADLLIRMPVVTTEVVARELKVDRSNVARAIRPLTEAGVLVSSSGRSRGIRLWRAPEVLAELDAFAERAGRRG